MKNSDIVVIGSGLAGLVAAAAAAEQGKKVTVITRGAGALAFGGGVIDLLGYQAGKPVQDVRQEILRLPAQHPYSVIGIEQTEAAIAFFKKLCAQEEYPYDGDSAGNMWLPTIAGTLKPSCLVPRSMNPEGFAQAEAITVITFAGLKDFYPELLIKGLRKLRGYDKQYRTAIVDNGLAGRQDVTTLDVARWLDTREGQNQFVQQLRDCMAPGSFALIPPVLGTVPDYTVWQSLQEQLHCRLQELVAPPPGITGNRLWKLLLRVLKKKGVDIIEQGYAQTSECCDQRCQAVITRHFGRERSYRAEAFILATGSFLGGGLVAEPHRVYEPLFELPLPVPATAALPSAADFFDPAGQPFAQCGLRINREMQPVDLCGDIVLKNVYAAGSILGGYDYCLEKSGNGVAVATGYQAAMSAIRGKQP